MSVRELAREAKLSDAHLSRVLRQAEHKTVSGDLVRRVAVALELEPAYFPETRLAVVVDEVKGHPRLRDRLFDELQEKKRRG
jgi:transcriptional regulator with XRE-family HTH domain